MLGIIPQHRWTTASSVDWQVINSHCQTSCRNFAFMCIIMCNCCILYSSVKRQWPTGRLSSDTHIETYDQREDRHLMTMTNGQIVIWYTHRDLWPTGRLSSDDNDQRADCHLMTMNNGQIVIWYTHTETSVAEILQWTLTNINSQCRSSFLTSSRSRHNISSIHVLASSPLSCPLTGIHTHNTYTDTTYNLPTD